MSSQNEGLGVSRQDRGSVVVLTIDRPEQGNALSRGLVDSLVDTLDRVSVEPGVRSVVLAAAGDVFCSGIDWSASTGSSVADMQALADLIDRVHAFPRPVVSALAGDALGAGAGLALAADLVVMGDSARLGFPEVSRGQVPALYLHDLIRQVGDRRARELLLTGRLVDSDLALSWGLVNQVVVTEHVREQAIRLASEFDAAGPVALSTIKTLLDESSGRPKTLRGAAAVHAAINDSDEAKEGFDALRENRPPRWSTLGIEPTEGDQPRGLS